MSHFLFIAGALRERSSEESAELQLSHGLWGLCTSLIQTNLHTYLQPHSRGLVYVLKAGLCAEFQITSPILSFAALDDLLKDDLKTEARFGFVRIAVTRRWVSTPHKSQVLLQEILQIDDPAELNRRLGLGMHRLTELEYAAIIRGIEEPMVQN
ncbi:MAG TPA: hypothetical protein VH681_06680 [Nitrospiraceae bacterium]|jgi:hypothetical protein